MSDLFDALRVPTIIAPGAYFLPGLLRDRAAELLAAIESIALRAPFRRLSTPGGRALSAEMTNCGEVGWHSDRHGYRYVSSDPISGHAWPSMPQALRNIAMFAAGRGGYPDFAPQLCLINRYGPGNRMGLHQDLDENNCNAPIVSVSLGLSARFLFGGLSRHDPTQSIILHHGDVVVWGGPSRLAYHGVAPIKLGTHEWTGTYRYNLTFRRIT